MHDSYPHMTRRLAPLALVLLAVTACGSEDAKTADKSTAPAPQVNQQDEARRNLAEAIKPYSIGDVASEEMGVETKTTAIAPLDDEVGDATANAQDAIPDQTGNAS